MPYFWIHVDEKNDAYILIILVVLISFEQLVNPEQCYRFVATNLDFNGMFALRMQLGCVFNIFMGISTGIKYI